MKIFGNKFIEFALAFATGLLFYRIFYFINPGYFKHPFTRSLIKLRWHHIHWGAVFILAAAIMLLVSGVNPWSIIVLGIGMGLIFDELIIILIFETERDEELRAYEKTLRPTLIMATFIVIAIVILAMVYPSF
ncbi:MAG: hypothetical protein NTW60_02920 [Candidatus Wolfebacteria bacterium]|nr:hypothetical protein [Candidatus Wolfebacteria bacterium]